MLQMGAAMEIYTTLIVEKHFLRTKTAPSDNCMTFPCYCGLPICDLEWEPPAIEEEK